MLEVDDWFPPTFAEELETVKFRKKESSKEHKIKDYSTIKKMEPSSNDLGVMKIGKNNFVKDHFSSDETKLSSIGEEIENFRKFSEVENRIKEHLTRNKQTKKFQKKVIKFDLSEDENIVDKFNEKLPCGSNLFFSNSFITDTHMPDYKKCQKSYNNF